MNIGECFFDHYLKFFASPPVSRRVFDGGGQSTLQILGFDNVFPHCRVFASLGLSNYGSAVEVVVAVDAEWEDAPVVMANALFYMLKNKLYLGRGTTVSGIAAISPGFQQNTGKSALYITTPFGVPDGFSLLSCAALPASVLMGIFISQEECEFQRAYGTERFETMLEDAGVDPFAIGRASLL